MEFNTYKPTIRMKAFKDAPLRSFEDYQIGFYDIGVMRELLEKSNSDEFRIAALPIPSNHFEREELKQIISHPSVQYALVDKNKIVLCSIKGSTGWMSALKDAGYKVKGGGKTAKRAKSFHRASLINAHFTNLNIKWVEPTDYTRYDFATGWADWVSNPNVLERLLDGGFVISSRIIQEAIKNLPIYDNNNSLDLNDIYYDPEIREKLKLFLVNSKVFNARILMDEGVIKGNMIVSDNLPLDVDVIVSRANLKSEVTYSSGFRLIAEPQGPKSRVITDHQTVVNLPKLFRKSDMESWLSEEYEKMFQDAIAGKLLSNWKSVFVRQFSRKNSTVELLEAQSRMNYVGYRWASMGLSITDSPWLFKTLAISHAAPLKEKIPIPCSLYEQVIPESLAKMAGFDIQVQEGDIRRLLEIGVHVVNDFDWLEMYESHGGHDEDDFFKLFYRTLTGGQRNGDKVVILARSPNGYGEYSIFNYVEDEAYPTWTKSNGDKVSFPEVNSRNWPKRLSTAIRSGEVRYTGLPSQYNPLPMRQVDDEYSINDVMSDVDTAMMGGNVGRYVHALMLHSSVLKKHRKVQACSMESAIDGCTQTSDSRDRTAIDVESELIIKEVIDSGKPVDHDLWYGRLYNLSVKHPEIETYSGPLTYMNDLCKHYHDKYVDRITQYSKTQIPLSDKVTKLSQRLYYHAIPVLREFRKGIYNTNSSGEVQSNGSLDRSDWESIYRSIVSYINTYQRIEDQHDFVLSLYAASVKIPTQSGNFSDQIVMNRIVYPYLEKAFIHYGIGNRVTMTLQNSTYVPTSTKYFAWTYIDPEGVHHTFNNPYEYQNFHSQYSPIVFTESDIVPLKEALY
jgi:hypothetical protein